MWDVHTYPFFGIRGIGIGAIYTNKRQIKSPAVNTLGHPITFEQFIHSRILARCILLILSPFYESWVKLQVHDPISLCTSWNYLYISGYIFTFNKCRRKKNDLSSVISWNISLLSVLSSKVFLINVCSSATSSVRYRTSKRKNHPLFVSRSRFVCFMCYFLSLR